jgi:MFS transporter, DHA1 family, inner membrane transport protein
MVARVIEGCGFFSVVLATPSLLSRLSASRDRDLIMALWSAYMPIGILAMLLLGPALPAFGWQRLWLANAALACLLGLVLSRALPVMAVGGAGAQPRFSGILEVLRNRRCGLMAGAFFAYSFHFFSLAFVLPLLLTAARGGSLANAALVSATAMIVSAVGNLASGPLLRLGFPTWGAIALTFVAYITSMIGIFAVGPATPVVAALAALALGVGGLAPGAIYASAPRAAPSPETLPITIGLFQQASNLGQFAGPLVVGLVIEQAGWESVPIATVPVAMFGLGVSLAIRRLISGPRVHTATGTSFGATAAAISRPG